MCVWIITKFTPYCHLCVDLNAKFLQPISVWQCGQNPATEERIPAGQERRNGAALRRTGLTAQGTRKRHTQGEELRHTRIHMNKARGQERWSHNLLIWSVFSLNICQTCHHFFFFPSSPCFRVSHWVITVCSCVQAIVCVQRVSRCFWDVSHPNLPSEWLLPLLCLSGDQGPLAVSREVLSDVSGSRGRGADKT